MTCQHGDFAMLGITYLTIVVNKCPDSSISDDDAGS